MTSCVVSRIYLFSDVPLLNLPAGHVHKNQGKHRCQHFQSIEAGDSSKRQEASVSDAADSPLAASEVFLFVSNQHYKPTGLNSR